MERSVPALPGLARVSGLGMGAARQKSCIRASEVRVEEHLEHLECSRQPHIQGRGAQKRTQRAG